MDLKIFTDAIEPGALEQINRLLEQPAFKNSKVRIMPDVHQGMGCVVGFTGDLGDKVIPNVVGVDIGCGILCVEISPHNLNLKLIDEVIRKYIPVGFRIHQNEQILPFGLEELYIFKKLNNISRIKSSLGTLGGG